MEIVLYHPIGDRIKLFELDRPYYMTYWQGEPFVPWKTLEIGISYGWIVIGVL